MYSKSFKLSLLSSIVLCGVFSLVPQPAYAHHLGYDEDGMFIQPTINKFMCFDDPDWRSTPTSIPKANTLSKILAEPDYDEETNTWGESDPLKEITFFSNVEAYFSKPFCPGGSGVAVEHGVDNMYINTRVLAGDKIVYTVGTHNAYEYALIPDFPLGRYYGGIIWSPQERKRRDDAVTEALNKNLPFKLQTVTYEGFRNSDGQLVEKSTDTKIVPMKNPGCVKIWGDGPIKVVGMRGKSSGLDIIALKEKVDDAITNGFVKIDPLAKYKDKFSFYLDLKNYDDASWASGIVNSTETLRAKAFDRIKGASSCRGFDAYAMYMNIPDINLGKPQGLSSDGRGTFALQPNADTQTFVHEFAHAFASLQDEAPQGITIMNTRDILGGNCSTESGKDWVYNGKYYGSFYNPVNPAKNPANIIGCVAVKIPSGDPIFRSSAMSIMNITLSTPRFNVPSCGLILRAINRKVSPANTYFPECALLDTQNKYEDNKFPYDVILSSKNSSKEIYKSAANETATIDRLTLARQASIATLYKTLLNRTPDIATLNTLTASPDTITQIKAKIVASTEYQKLHPVETALATPSAKKPTIPAIFRRDKTSSAPQAHSMASILAGFWEWLR